MKPLSALLIPATAMLLGACATSTPQPSGGGDACGASEYASLVGGPSSAVVALDIPGDSRHYGSEEPVATNVPTRLNFVHSGTAIDAVVDPTSTVVRVFCG